MPKNLRLILLGLILFGCGRAPVSQNAINSPAINLGSAGNNEVAGNFKAYSQRGALCQANGTGPKVLLTGFARFEGDSANISGSLVEYLAKLSQPRGLLTEDHGAVAFNQTISVRGRDVQICLLEVQVNWDLAAAIIAFEMQNLQPDFVFMLGQGGWSVIFEWGAQNRGSKLSGAGPTGSDDDANTPTELLILKDGPSSLKMTWNSAALKSATSKIVAGMKFEVVAPTQARRENDYVCNNISYVALAAARNLPLYLAGGEIVLTPHFERQPIVGFAHLPDTHEINFAGWSAFISATIQQVLHL